MRGRSIPLKMKIFPVIFTLTVMRRQAMPLEMKVFVVTFTLIPNPRVPDFRLQTACQRPVAQNSLRDTFQGSGLRPAWAIHSGL